MQRLLCLASSLLLLLAATAAAQDPGAQVASTCSACHAVGRVCNNLGKDQSYWKQTVARMADNGAKVAGGEVDSLAAYLAGQTKANAPFCK
jgi:cytochrome c5